MKTNLFSELMDTNNGGEYNKEEKIHNTVGNCNIIKCLKIISKLRFRNINGNFNSLLIFLKMSSFLSDI